MLQQHLKDQYLTNHCYMLEARITFKSTTYSLNAVNADHNEPIYCMGYNYVTSVSERSMSSVICYVRNKNLF